MTSMPGSWRAIWAPTFRARRRWSSSTCPALAACARSSISSKHAPKDGTVIALFDYTQITNSLLTPDKVPIDFRKFKWIGSVAQDLAVCYVWHTVNAKTVDDMRKLPEINMGRTNVGTSSDTQQKILRKLFKVNVHSVAGYAGSAEGFIAVERGELEGGCMTWASLPPPGSPTTRSRRSCGSRRRPRPICRRACRAPSICSRPTETVRFCACSRPPAKSASRWSRKSRCRTSACKSCAPRFAAMVKDPAFLADAEKARQVVSPTLGDAAVKILDEIYSSPEDIIEAARADRQRLTGTSCGRWKGRFDGVILGKIRACRLRRRT